MVASDRLSAFDVVMDEPIPDKGRVLTGADPLLGARVRRRRAHRPGDLRPRGRSSASCRDSSRDREWHGRTMLVRRAADAAPRVHRARAPRRSGLRRVRRARARSTTWRRRRAWRLTDPFPEPIFTPSTKATSGHDVNIDLDAAAALVGAALLARGAGGSAWTSSPAPPRRMAAVGLVLADTKFELGFVDGRLVVCDEVLTPDSSRIWPADQVAPGETPPRFDKQPFRDWLAAQPWDRTPPPPYGPRRDRRDHLGALRRGLRAGDRSLTRRLVRCVIVKFSSIVDVTLREGIADPEGRHHRAGPARPSASPVSRTSTPANRSASTSRRPTRRPRSRRRRRWPSACSPTPSSRTRRPGWARGR